MVYAAPLVENIGKINFSSKHYTCIWTQIRKVGKGLCEVSCSLSDVFIHVLRIRIHKHFAELFENFFFSFVIFGQDFSI